MSNNTKQRTQELATVARYIIERDEPQQVMEGGRLLPMAKTMIAATGCNVDTAKRHLARQLRIMRGELVKAHGGKREGAGYPAGVKRDGRRGKAQKSSPH